MKPICPYCPDGVEMTLVRESVWMTRGHDWVQCPKCASRGPEIRTDNGDWEGKQEAAISAALQRYVEPNRVLTPEDLQSMEGEPVFIQQGDGDEYWSVVEGGSLLIGECDPDFQDMTCSFDKDGHFGLHVLGWRALARRPTDEERRAVAWEESK
jgi:hypothetical protein